MAQGFVHPEYLVDTGWLLVSMTRTRGGCFACSATSARWCTTADSRNGARKVGQSKADPPGRVRRRITTRVARAGRWSPARTTCSRRSGMRIPAPSMRCVPGNTPAPVAYITLAAAISRRSVNMATVDENNACKSAEDPPLVCRASFQTGVITYCGGEIAAMADTQVLTMHRHNNVRLYEASLSEWARDPALPIQM